MNEELLQIKRCQDAGYHPQIYFEGWRVAYLNDTPKFHLENMEDMQRHNTSDEVFVLLKGSCTLYIGDGGDEGPAPSGRWNWNPVLFIMSDGVHGTPTPPGRMPPYLLWKTRMCRRRILTIFR